MKSYNDPGEDFELRPRRKRKGVSLPAPPSLFDVSDKPPETPFQIKSPTSRDAASEIREETKAKRRELVKKCIQGSPRGLARFQIAAALSVRDHWVTSSVVALIEMREIEEHPSRTVVNPASGKRCAVVISRLQIESPTVNSVGVDDDFTSEDAA